MTNVAEQELETIVDNELVDAIEKWKKAQAECERLAVTSDALGVSEKAAGRSTSTTLRRAECDTEDAAEAATVCLGEWRRQLDEYDIGVVYEGVVYPPPGLNDGDVYEVKQLRSSGKPRAAAEARNGHLNKTTAAPAYQCAADVPTVDTIPDNASHRDVWRMTIRRAIADWREAKRWAAEVNRVFHIAEGSAEYKKNQRSWIRASDLNVSAISDAEARVCDYILAYHGKLNNLDELEDGWEAVGFEVDGLLYLVRGDSDDADEENSRPVLEVTRPGAIELATA